MKIRKSIVIHQPNFLPWLGYFAKLVYADKLVVLDNVMFSKRKHIDRVEVINSEGKKIWIGLPVGDSYRTPCNKIYFNDKNHIDKIIRTLYSSYSKARFFKENIDFISDLLTNSIKESDLLSEIDIHITKGLISLLKIDNIEIIKSSSFIESAFLKPTDRLIYLCEKMQCKKLIVGSTKATDIHEVRKMNRYGVDILLQDYLNNHPEYYQTRRTRLGFAKGLSIIDPIFNIGIEETRNLLNLKPASYGG